MQITLGEEQVPAPLPQRRLSRWRWLLYVLPAGSVATVLLGDTVAVPPVELAIVPFAIACGSQFVIQLAVYFLRRFSDITASLTVARDTNSYTVSLTIIRGRSLRATKLAAVTPGTDSR